MLDNFSGMKEMYDISIRLNNPIEFNGKKFDTNETLFMFDKAEIANIDERKTETQAKGGYHNIPLINWEVDKEMRFALNNYIMLLRIKPALLDSF